MDFYEGFRLNLSGDYREALHQAYLKWEELRKTFKKKKTKIPKQLFPKRQWLIWE